MPGRRRFLKQLALPGTAGATATPVSFALGQSESPQVPGADQVADGTFAVAYRHILFPKSPLNRHSRGE